MKNTRLDKELIGNYFGNLFVIERSSKVSKKSRAKHYFCQCSCGNLCCIEGSSIKNGSITMCGPCGKQLAGKKQSGKSKNNTKHGHGREHNNSPEYRTWMAMNTRCFNKNVNCYKDYGGRGITVCKRWRNSFTNFLNDMGRKPSPKHTIERIDNNKGYFPENCKWILNKKQSWNRRKKNTKSKGNYIGVYPSGNKWMAKIVRKGIVYYLGTFNNELQAHKAYKKKKQALENT